MLIRRNELLIVDAILARYGTNATGGQRTTFVHYEYKNQAFAHWVACGLWLVCGPPGGFVLDDIRARVPWCYEPTWGYG